jgi:hypothetical protein
MWLQAVVLLAGASAVALVEPTAAWILCLALLVSWGALNRSYAHSLDKRPRVEGRAEGDAAVTIQVALATVVPAALALVAFGTKTRIWHAAKAGTGLTALSTFWLVVYVSSLIDWYGIRPRRDGVVVDPPCKTSGSSSWTDVTRVWHGHRSIAVVLCLASVMVAWTAFGLLALGDTSKMEPIEIAGLVVSGAVAGVGLVRLFFGHVGNVGTALASCVLSEPDIALGDEIIGPEGFAGGFVRDVALEGITVVPLDARGRPGMTPDGQARTRRHLLADVIGNPQIRAETCIACSSTPGCLRINEDCHWVLAEDDGQRLVATKGRWFVL